MKLEELQKKMSESCNEVAKTARANPASPAAVDAYRDALSRSTKQQLAYEKHAIRMLPEMLQTLKWVRGSMLKHARASSQCGYNFKASLDALEETLNNAENVEV
jgi:hypothetical protein